MSPEKITMEKSLRPDFSTTNNKAKYEVLIVKMTMVKRLEGKAVEDFLDLRLIVGQIKGEFEARN